MKLNAFITVIVLFCSCTARAMPIPEFSRMNDDDEATYVTALVEGAAALLKSQGHADQAQKAIALFNDPGKKGGVNQLAINLKDLNTANNRHSDNPNNRVPELEVEDAMELTLKDNGIIVPVSYLRSINKDFSPTGPPRGLNAVP
jgi:hypothetical protein